MTFKFTLKNADIVRLTNARIIIIIIIINRVAVSNVIRQIVPVSSGRVLVTTWGRNNNLFACDQQRGDGEGERTANCDYRLWMVKRSHKYVGVLWCKTLKVIKACLCIKHAVWLAASAVWWVHECYVQIYRDVAQVVLKYSVAYTLQFLEVAVSHANKQWVAIVEPWADYAAGDDSGNMVRKGLAPWRSARIWK